MQIGTDLFTISESSLSVVRYKGLDRFESLVKYNLSSYGEERYYCSIANHDNFYIFVTGGWRKYDRKNSVYRYTLRGDSWKQIPSMTQPRESHSSIVFKEKLYVLGGYIDWDKGHTPLIESLGFYTDKKWQAFVIKNLNLRAWPLVA